MTFDGPPPGMVLTREGEDVPLNPDEKIDLRKEPAGASGNPSFTTRQADPMRPFTAKQRAPGDEDAFRAATGAGKKVSPFLGDNLETTAKLVDEVILKSLRPDQRGRVLEAVQRSFRPDPMSPTGQPRRERDAFHAGAAFHDIGDSDAKAARRNIAIKEVLAMVQAPRLQKLTETGYHKLLEAMRSGEIIVPHSDAAYAISQEKKLAGVVPEYLNAQVFILENNWGAAFENATGMDGGPLELPFERTVFEFRVSGHRICCLLASESDNHAAIATFDVETSAGWCATAGYAVGDDGVWVSMNKIDPYDIFAPVTDLCRKQIQAITVALSAEVAETEIVRAPFKLNKKREYAGKLPIFDYHTVKLANRKRYTARLPDPGDIEEPEHRRRRLHFVRAHDRHYVNYKVRIPWHLRGDPDLGFVDKEYLL